MFVPCSGKWCISLKELVNKALSTYIGALTRSQRNFNRKLSKDRAKVKQAFGMLTTRWHCLKNQLVEPMDQASKTISVCCILHNICVDMNDKIDHSDSDGSDSDHGDDNIQAYNTRGKQVRESIRRFLHELQISPEGIL